MKKLICLMTGVLPLSLLAQDAKYTITGKVGNYNAPAKIYLQYRVDTKSVTDSAILVKRAVQLYRRCSAFPKECLPYFK